MKAKTLAVAALAFTLLSGGGSAYAAKQPDLRKDLVPYKALYDIKMVARHSGAQILNIRGQMSFEWQALCDAWITDHHFKLLYEYADGLPMNIASDFSTYEAMNGQQFNFTSRRERDGELFEELRGSATPQKAAYNVPADLSFDLPKGTMFPMGHTVETVRQLKEGKKFFNAVVFDGSDSEGPVEVNTFIGKPANAMSLIKPSPGLDAELVNTRAWNVRMAFFPLSGDETVSDYEMDVVLHENGVISDMLVEYNDFSVTQRLTAIEKLPLPDCGQATQTRPKKDGWFRREPKK